MIRFANKNDVDEINSLGIIVNKNFISTYDINNYLNNSNYYILLNYDENSVNGLLIMHKNYDFFELEIIVVSEKYRNRGIASNLLKFFIDSYVLIEPIILEVSVNNEYAINLYKKFNFDIINIRKKYYNGIDAYVMKRVVK